MPAAKQIDFYLDFTSPYAYLASTQIEALAARQYAVVIWRPFLIGASFKISGRKAPIDHPLVRDYTLNDVQRYARLLGQPLNFPLKFPILSVKPGRCFYYLERRDNNQIAAKKFAADAFRAYFVDRKDLSKTPVLSKLLAPYGVSLTELNALMESPDVKQLFRDAVDQALQKQVFGAPTFVIDGEMFWGVDRMTHLEQWLQTGGW